ncbi:MAG: hypothetical protein WD178_07040, partial [Actinomycetota bacterium]
MAGEGLPDEHLEPVESELPNKHPKLKQQEAIRRWNTAEQQLYPALLSSPAGYERHMSLVRGICDELGPVRDIGALVDAFDEGLDIARTAAEARSLSTEGLDLELVVGAAFCLRYREVLAEVRREAMKQRIDEALARDDLWVDLEGSPPFLHMPFPPWRRIEMRLPDGTGIHSWVEESLDGSGDGFEYGVEVVELDPQTGGLLSDAPAGKR